MESIKINRPVHVKVKVTEGYKRQVAVEVQESIKRIDMELQHLEFQSRKILNGFEKQNTNGILKFKEKIKKEKQKRVETKEKLTQKVKEIAQLANGGEVLQGTMESIEEVKVGDNWNKVMGMEILLCDEEVIEIRPRKSLNID